MKSILLILSVFTLFLAKAQYYTTTTANSVNVKKECQACYKNLEYTVIGLKWNSDCPTDDQIYKMKVGCLVDFILYLSYNSLVVDKIEIWRTIHDSKCSESNSGKHLWKEISSESTIITENQKYPLNKDWCDIIESAQNENPVSFLNYRAARNLVMKWQKE
ncbi:MAG: hypothetical protein RLZZ198_840 [Bacteroidota bacterium]|jgi:hypothetical protein